MRGWRREPFSGRLSWVFLIVAGWSATAGYAAHGDRSAPGIGLATVDSMLEAGSATDAVARARTLWESAGTDPLYGWQIAGRLGLALLRSGQPEASLQFFEYTLGVRPRQADMHRNLASALRILGRKGRALAEYQTAADMAPTDPDLHLEYGQMLLEYRMWGRAEQELQLAARLCGGCLDTERALANLYLGWGDYSRAASHLGRLWQSAHAVSTGRTYVAALARAGERRHALALLDSLPAGAVSEAEWKLAVQAEKDDADLGTVWSQRAVARLETPAQTGVQGFGTPPEDALFWAAAGGNLQRDGLLEPALAALDHALFLAPTHSLYRRNRVAVLLALGRRETAEREWAGMAAADSTIDGAKGP